MSTPPRRPCVCNGPPIAPLGSGTRSIREAVDAHSETPEHQRWRYDALLAGDLVTPETPAENLTRTLGIPVPYVRPVITSADLVGAGKRRPYGRWDGEL